MTVLPEDHVRTHWFEVQHDTVADGWINTWSDEKGRLARFRSRATAQKELTTYLENLHEDVSAGRIAPYLDDEFRVARIEVGTHQIA